MTSQTIGQGAAIARGVAEGWLQELQALLDTGDTEALALLFGEEAYWRDIVAFTWNVKTLEGRTAIAEMLDSCLPHIQPKGFTLSADPVVKDDGVIELWASFETAVGQGTAIVRLVDGKAWTLLTVLEELTGFEESTRTLRPLGTSHGADPGRVTWTEKRDRETAELGHSEQPDVLILGGGQGGIALAARLRQLNVSTLVVEKNERAGDSWRNRYKSLCLHDPVWFDHLPYIPFPDSWPIFTPKDKMGDWLEMYVRVMDLNYWTSTVAKSAHFDDEQGRWTVLVEKAGQSQTLHPKHLVFAMGMSGKPFVPAIPGQEKFGGDQHHSSSHPGADLYRGKKAVVVGSNNSSHDICQALWENGADVTMIQRSGTTVVSLASSLEFLISGLYSEEAATAGLDTHTADLLSVSTPYAVATQIQKEVVKRMRERDAEFYDALEKAGFELDFGEDETGSVLKYARRGSGYYIDVGASKLIINGDIKLAKGEIAELTSGEVVLDGGERLEADLVVYATGYSPMSEFADELLGPEVASKVGRTWGLGSDTAKDPGPWEGELRNMWKPTKQDGLWFHGGNLQQSRFFSQYLALQLKARLEGLDTPVYGQQEVHHKR